MRTPNIITFYHEYDQYGCFSNWYKADFSYPGTAYTDGFKYTSVEQFMMYQKVLLFREYDLAHKILNSSDPSEIKRLGRSPIAHFDADLWDRISYVMVKRAVRAKFEQHEDLRRILLGTGNTLLAEAAPNDLKWGIGLACDDPERTDVRRWRGQNLLGRILMEVRDEMHILEQNGRIDFVDVSWMDFPEWLMTAGELVRIPKYHNSIRAYADSLRNDHERNCFYHYGPIKEWDIAMRTNMGGGLPIIGFYEMKQDIYDLSRL